MSQEVIIELVGYIGSALVLISFLMVSVYKLRVVNSIGSLVCVIYGTIIHAYPTVLMNVALILINVYYLVKMTKTQKNYDLVSVRYGDGLVRYMIERYREDIEKCFPGIKLEFEESDVGFVVCHEGKPVGILIGKLTDYNLDIKLDYTIPEYQDFSIGEFLISMLPNHGIDRLIYRGSDENHKEYLKRTGFVKKEDYYEKIL